MPHQTFRLTTDDLAELPLVERLALRPEAGGTIFRADPASNYVGRIFGGHTLAQACLAASATIDDDSSLCSFKAYFLSPGNVEEPLEYRTRVLRDGRTLAIREVAVFQGERQLVTWQGMFSTVDDREQPLQPPAPKVPSPDELLPLHELRVRHPSSPDGFRWPPGADWMRSSRPFDVRYAGSPAGEPGTRCYWLRAEAISGATQNTHRAILAFASDHSFATGVSHARGDLAAGTKRPVASLDHDMWFHRDVCAGNWYLYVQRSPFSTDRFGLIQGSMYDHDGLLIATTAQQVLRSAASS